MAARAVRVTATVGGEERDLLYLDGHEVSHCSLQLAQDGNRPAQHWPGPQTALARTTHWHAAALALVLRLSIALALPPPDRRGHPVSL